MTIDTWTLGSDGGGLNAPYISVGLEPHDYIYEKSQATKQFPPIILNDEKAKENKS